MAILNAMFECAYVPPPLRLLGHVSLHASVLVVRIFVSLIYLCEEGIEIFSVVKTYSEHFFAFHSQRFEGFVYFPDSGEYTLYVSTDAAGSVAMSVGNWKNGGFPKHSI